MTRPRNEKIRALKNCTLCAMTMGLARRSRTWTGPGRRSPSARVAARDAHGHVGRQRQPARRLRRWPSPRSRRRPRARLGRRLVEPILGLAHLALPSATAFPATSVGVWRGAGGTRARAHSSSERSAIASSLSGRWPAMDNQVVVHGAIGCAERARALLGEAQGDAAAVGVLLAAVHQAAGDQAVDQSRDGRTSHGQAVGQTRRRPRSLRRGSRAPGTGAASGRPSSRPPRPAWRARPPRGRTSPGPGAGLRWAWRRLFAPTGRTGGVGGEVTDISTIIQLGNYVRPTPSGRAARGSSTRDRAGAGTGRSAAPRRSPRWSLPRVRAREGPQETSVGLVAPADIARATPARRPQRIEPPVVAHPGEGVTLDGVLGQLGQVRPRLQAARVLGRHRRDLLPAAVRREVPGCVEGGGQPRGRGGRGQSRGCRR